MTAIVRPRYRGVIHAWATPIFAVLFAGLIASAERDRWAVVVYALGVTAMLGVSAVYHSGRFSPEAMRRMKRVDHSTILLAIGGTYTAVTALGLSGTHRMRMLAVIWIATILGVAVRMLWIGAPYWVASVVYVVVGWLMILDLGAYIDALSDGQLVLLAAGGVLYTVGAVIYALHKPNPWPEHFGYHEVFHALVVTAALLHFAAVLDLVSASG